MVIGNQGAIGKWGAVGSQAAMDEEDPRLQISVAENPQCLHAVGNMTAGEHSPQACCTQGGG